MMMVQQIPNRMVCIFILCCLIAGVEWALYACGVAMSIVQCKLMQMNVGATHTHASHIAPTCITRETRPGSNLDYVRYCLLIYVGAAMLCVFI
jgi:hypothetical protein